MSPYKSCLGVRGDSVYCPLAFSLDSYWNCLNNCHHCYLRALNHTWGRDLRPSDPDAVHDQLRRGLNNRNPKTPLAHCIAKKKTLRLGNKSDPFQKAERTHRVSQRMLEVLIDLRWTFVIQTMDTEVMMDYVDLILAAHELKLVTVMPIISPGLDRDWEVLERKRTNPPGQRLRHLRYLSRQGVPVGVNGEPFIPGFHTVGEFDTVLGLLREYGINRYNTYNLHLNPHVAKRFHSIGLDIERIWRKNKDEEWRKILRRLLIVAQSHDVILGCPDFVNSGWGWREQANTCCGVDVPNPTTWNTHHWKRRVQDGETLGDIANETWDGSGDLGVGLKVLTSPQPQKFYTLKDILS